MSTNGTSTAQTANLDVPQATLDLGVFDDISPASTQRTDPAPSAPEQLTLLATTSIPLQFRLDERTRRAGLHHVAQLRAQIAEQSAARRLSPNTKRQVKRAASRQIAA